MTDPVWFLIGLVNTYTGGIKKKKPFLYRIRKKHTFDNPGLLKQKVMANKEFIEGFKITTHMSKTITKE